MQRDFRARDARGELLGPKQGNRPARLRDAGNRGDPTGSEPATSGFVHDLFRLHLVRHVALLVHPAPAVARAGEMARSTRDERDADSTTDEVDDALAEKTVDEGHQPTRGGVLAQSRAERAREVGVPREHGVEIASKGGVRVERVSLQRGGEAVRVREEEPAGEVDAGEEAFQPTFLRVRVRGGATGGTVRVAGVASRRRGGDADEFGGADAVHRVSADGAKGHALLREEEVVSGDEADGTEEGDAASDLSRAAGGGVSVGDGGDDARALTLVVLRLVLRRVQASAIWGLLARNLEDAPARLVARPGDDVVPSRGGVHEEVFGDERVARGGGVAAASARPLALAHDGSSLREQRQ